MTKEGQVNNRAFRRSGLWIIFGGAMLIIEFLLIQLNLVTVELTDQKIDLVSICMAIMAWTGLFIGLSILCRTETFYKNRKAFYVSLTGLACYTVGCLAILFEQWTIIYVVPVGLLLTALGMIIIGIIVRKVETSALIGYLSFAVGLYPFLFMFPIVAIKGAPNYSVNYFWGFIWTFLGLVVLIQSRKLKSTSA